LKRFFIEHDFGSIFFGREWARALLPQIDQQLSQFIGAMMAWAMLFGALSMYAGLLISYYFNLAAGASVVLVTTLLFFIVLVIQNIRSRSTPRRTEMAHG